MELKYNAELLDRLQDSGNDIVISIHSKELNMLHIVESNSISFNDDNIEIFDGDLDLVLDLNDSYKLSIEGEYYNLIGDNYELIFNPIN